MVINKNIIRHIVAKHLRKSNFIIYNTKHLKLKYLVSPLVSPMDKVNKIPITWNTSVNNVDGVKPPNPQMKVGEFNRDHSGYPLFQIEARYPYKVQYMVNKYGGHQSRFGTMLHLK